MILPIPCWVSFTEQVKMAGGRPVLVPTRDHQLDVDAMAAAITGRTRVILINSPTTPPAPCIRARIWSASPAWRSGTI